ncbi:MAG: hypothetical protein CBB71_00715 [Rhodopirellula sp. TMED11]|nr:MAG: hypothetical protein CBB71_00715 [Rhodopirellula sp. TMED11]
MPCRISLRRLDGIRRRVGLNFQLNQKHGFNAFSSVGRWRDRYDWNPLPGADRYKLIDRKKLA